LALEQALSKHGLETFGLLGVTTVLEAIASGLKLHNLQGIAGQEMGELGQKAYSASTIPRRIALLQRPSSATVNPMMESIAVALKRSKSPLEEEALRLASYRVFLSKPRATIRSSEQENSSLSPAFSSARDYLIEGLVIVRTETGAWRLNDLWEMI
jgi:hypothetical protein